MTPPGPGHFAASDVIISVRAVRLRHGSGRGPCVSCRWLAALMTFAGGPALASQRPHHSAQCHPNTQGFRVNLLTFTKTEWGDFFFGYFVSEYQCAGSKDLGFYKVLCNSISLTYKPLKRLLLGCTEAPSVLLTAVCPHCQSVQTSPPYNYSSTHWILHTPQFYQYKILYTLYHIINA